MEWIEISLGKENATDDCYFLQDSLHPEIREYLIGGDGWMIISNYVWNLDLPAHVSENESGYKLLHEVYLNAKDYEVAG